MVEEARAFGYPFPYLYDESQAIAKAYRPPALRIFSCSTPAASWSIAASSTAAGRATTFRDWCRSAAAVDAVLAGRSVAPEQKPSIGCNIKWKAGNEPDYYR